MTAAVAVREGPILMSGPMVRATLEDRKTKTRRVVLPQPEPWAGGWKWHTRQQRIDRGAFGIATSDADSFARVVAEACPYGQPGDRLWVRETWGQFRVAPSGIVYKAGPEHECGAPERWRPSIHMPRWASRLTLELTDVRVERVQEISEADILAEGITVDRVAEWCGVPWSSMPTLHHAWRVLWDSLNAKRGYGWDVNPWVWCLTFRRVES